MRTTLFRLFSVFLIAALLLSAQGARPTAAAGSRCYVDASASGTATGDSWANAYKTVQDALADANCTEIWVAAGVYYPDEGTGQINDDRASTFQLKNGVALYGGFAGTETARDQRDPAANITVLSGDIDKNDTTDANGVVTYTANIQGNNAYHVVTGSGTDSTAMLDGFVITAGQANGTSDNSGGGMYNSAGSPTLTNVTFSANSANFLGGGMYNDNSSPTLTDVTFSGNSATFGGGMNNNPNSNPILTNVTFAGNSAINGGGMENANNSNPKLVNVTFSGNTASDSGGGLTAWNSTPSLTNVTFSANSAQYGGGMLNYNSSSTLTNVTFSANSATIDGGGMLNDASSPTLTNVIIANSTAGGDCVNVNGGSIAPSSANNIIEDSTNACDLTNGVNGNIIGVDPNLGALTDFGGPGKQVFPLLSGSPAIDAGTNTGCPATDQRGAARPTDGNGDGTATCDIGAYETDAAALVTPGAGGGDGPGGVGITDGSSSLELWLKADAGVTTSGSSVSTWADQSGNGADVTQGSATSQPTHVTSLASLNNQPAVQFDGSNDYLNIPASVIEGKTAFSFFTAFQWNGGNAWQRVWDFGLNTTVNGFVTTRNSATNTPRFAITTGGGFNEQRLTFSSALPTGSGQMIDVVWNVPNGGGWRNGTSEASGASYTLTPNSLGTITQHYIGKSIYSADPYLNAYIGDYIVFSTALNDTERILVENYLSAKYNVALSANDVYDGDDNANGDFDLNVAGIGQFGGNQHTQAQAAGMIVVDRSFLNDDGDWLLFGHNVAANSNVTTDLPTTGDWATAPNPQRWARSFYIDVTDNTTGVNCATPGTCLVDIIFDFSEGGMGNGKSPAGPASNYRLLKRTGSTGQFSDIATATAIVGDQVQFLGVDVSLLGGSNFTLGTLDSGTSPIGAVDNTAPVLQSFTRQTPVTSPTNTDTLTFRATFSEDVQNVDAADFAINATPGTTAAISNVVAVDAKTYDITVSGGNLATYNGVIGLDLAAGQNITDLAGNALPAGEPATDETYTVDNQALLLTAHNLQATYALTGPSSFTVTFNKAVNDPAGNSDPDDVTNPANYLLIEKGPNGTADTASCVAGVSGDDVRKTVTAVSYDNTTFKATVTLAGTLPAGNYRLFVCGTTSIVDLAGNPINGGTDFTFDFRVQAQAQQATTLPATGFPIGQVTRLPAQPAAKAYTATDLILEIPSLGIQAPIVGVLQSDQTWDVSWLGNAVGWLEGSAFPTWAGNTVITGHVWDADNTPGVFAQIRNLKYGDRFYIHAFGQTYVYEVRENTWLWGARRVDKVFKHEELDWVTLLTCEGYNPLGGNYLFRRMVRAVLVEVK